MNTQTIKVSIPVKDLVKRDPAELVTSIMYLSEKLEQMYGDLQYYRGLTEGYNRVFNKLRVDTVIKTKIARSRKK